MRPEPVRILLVEDNSNDARLIESMLARSDSPRFELRTATSLGASLAALAGERVDIVLLDLRLPDCDGLETLQRLREVARETPVIIVTGMDDRDLAVEAIRHGARAYLVKDRVDHLLLARTLVRHVTEVAQA